MDKYQALHPFHTYLIDYLNSQHIPHNYDSQWITKLESNSQSIQSQAQKKCQQLVVEETEGLDPANCIDFFKITRQAVIVSLIQTKYQDAIQLLNNYATVVQFSTQPSTCEALTNNRYVEFLFLQYVVNVFHLIWFPLDDNKFNTSSSGVYIKDTGAAGDNKLLLSSNSFKPIDTIFKKVSIYYTKNEIIFSKLEEDPHSNMDELHYYWIIRFLNLCMLFKQFKFMEFYQEFTSLFINYHHHHHLHTSSGLTPLKYLITDTSILKSNILTMFAIVSIFLKPFYTLSLIDICPDADLIIDLFNENEVSLEYKIYNQVLIPLSNRETEKVYFELNKNQSLIETLVAYLEYNLPVSVSRFSSFSFIEYMKSIIDFKNFMVIISSTKEIPITRVCSLLGYDSSDGEIVAQITNNLICCISALGLNKSGITYIASQGVFIHSEPDQELPTLELQDKIEELNHDLKGNAMASIMKNILVEKFFN